MQHAESLDSSCVSLNSCCECRIGLCEASSVWEAVDILIGHLVSKKARSAVMTVMSCKHENPERSQTPTGNFVLPPTTKTPGAKTNRTLTINHCFWSLNDTKKEVSSPRLQSLYRLSQFKMAGAECWQYLFIDEKKSSTGLNP